MNENFREFDFIDSLVTKSAKEPGRINCIHSSQWNNFRRFCCSEAASRRLTVGTQSCEDDSERCNKITCIDHLIIELSKVMHLD